MVWWALRGLVDGFPIPQKRVTYGIILGHAWRLVRDSFNISNDVFYNTIYSMSALWFIWFSPLLGECVWVNVCALGFILDGLVPDTKAEYWWWFMNYYSNNKFSYDWRWSLITAKVHIIWQKKTFKDQSTDFFLCLNYLYCHVNAIILQIFFCNRKMGAHEVRQNGPPGPITSHPLAKCSIRHY